MSLRRILPAEARALRAAGMGNMVSHDQEHIVAIDSVVIITHPSNPVKEITIAGNLLDLFSGIAAIAGDNEWKYSVSSPSFLVSGLAVAGN